MPHIRQVYERLKELQNALADFRQLILKEREDIVKLNLPGLEERRTEIDDFSGRLQKINELASAEIRAACLESGLNDSSNLTSLLAAVPKPDRELFVQLQHSVQRFGVQVENELAVNRALLKDSLEFTTSSLQMFTRVLKGVNTPVYGQQGRFVESVDQPRIICKEI